MHQETPLLVVKVIMHLFNANPIKVASSKEVVKLFNGSIKNNKSTPIKQMGHKSPFLPWNMSF